MATRKTVTAKNLIALGAERLADILFGLAEGDRDIKRRLRLELAEQAGGEDLASEIGITIVNGVLSDHVHMMVEIPPHIAVSDFVRSVKGRSSRKIQQEFPAIRKRYWGRKFWGRGFFSTTAGNVTEDAINAYIDNHVDAHQIDQTRNISID